MEIPLKLHQIDSSISTEVKENTDPVTASFEAKFSTDEKTVLSRKAAIKKSHPRPQRVLKSSTPCTTRIHSTMINNINRGLLTPQRVLLTPRHVSNLDDIPETLMAGFNYGTSSLQLNRASTLNRNQLSARRVAPNSTAKKNYPTPQRVPTTPIKLIKDPTVAILNFDTPSPESNKRCTANGSSKLFLKLGPESDRIDEMSFSETLDLESTKREMIEQVIHPLNESFEGVEGSESCSFTLSTASAAEESFICNEDNEECNSEIIIQSSVPVWEKVIEEERTSKLNNVNDVLPEAYASLLSEQSLQARVEEMIQKCAAQILPKIICDLKRNMLVQDKSCTVSVNELKQIKSDDGIDSDLDVLIEHNLSLGYRSRVIPLATYRNN
uniref:Uncharacterized protein n=1 Tax=Strigamia maritima TaxID=126957 RepID=T1JJQ8_STRMM